MSSNKHGLSRDIPEHIKRQVRQDCGFACVWCETKLGRQYDHFDPEFKDCIEHAATGIALLCADCHDKKTSGSISNSQIREMRNRAKTRWRDPAWSQQYRGNNVSVQFGNNLLVGPSAGLIFGEVELLRIDAAADSYEPWALSGKIVDGAGALVQFDRNDVVVCKSNWDVEIKGQLLTFRRGPGKIALQLRFTPEQIIFERLALKWPSGVELDIYTSGRMEMRNLRHSGNGNTAQQFIFENTEMTSGPSGQDGRMVSSFSMGEGCRHIKASVIGVSGCKFGTNGGFVDLAKTVELDKFLSADMLLC